MTKTMNLIAATLLSSMIGIAVAHARIDDSDSPKPNYVRSITRSAHSVLKASYPDLSKLLEKKIELVTYITQLNQIESELEGDLKQVLNLKSSPKNLKDKRWSKDDMTRIINEYLTQPVHGASQ
jgi:hypothetical protein